MVIQRVTLSALALGFLLVASAVGQDHHSMGSMGVISSKPTYDPEPRGGDPNTPVGCAGVEAKITINGISFSPETITVDPGQPVCWTWSGDTEHTIKADDGSFTTGNPSDKGNFQTTFTKPGTHGYFCQVHGTLTSGMRGKVIVRGDVPSGPGTIGFAPSGYEVSEGAGTLTVAVERTDGSDGVATVKVATANGTAKGGKDFTARTVTLRWESGDQSLKTVDIPIKNDTAKEPDESFTIKLSKSGTGAFAIGTNAATVTIHDDDGAGCGASLAAASQLRAAGQSGGEIRLTWADAATGAKAFHVERRSPGGAFQEIAAVAQGAESFLDSGLPAGSTFQYRIRTEALDGSVAFSTIAAGATDGLTTACDESRALCLGNGRFEATVEARRGAKRVMLPEDGNAGLFSLSADQDLQVLLNVRDGCAANNHYWLDFAAVTETEFMVKVRDTQTGRTWVYFHPAGAVPAPVRDVEAFATCP